ncbi:DUF4169 family protein [Roseococcus sp. SDR]|uniref:DUF4169 family protein n=1 Tax=Roseococcus sp. SDR TaxID=2835532 RepID=UPI00352FFC7E
MNLRKWRKAREKAEAEAQAAANRAAFGRSKAEKKRDAAEAAQRDALLEGSRMDSPDKP